MRPHTMHQVGRLVAITILGSVLGLVLLGAGAAVRQRWGGVTEPHPLTGTSVGAQRGGAMRAALAPPAQPSAPAAGVGPVLLVASADQAALVERAVAGLRASGVLPVGAPRQVVVRVVSDTPSANQALGASLQQLVLGAQYPLGPVLDLRPPQ